MVFPYLKSQVFKCLLEDFGIGALLKSKVNGLHGSHAVAALSKIYLTTEFINGNFSVTNNEYRFLTLGAVAVKNACENKRQQRHSNNEN